MIVRSKEDSDEDSTTIEEEEDSEPLHGSDFEQRTKSIPTLDTKQKKTTYWNLFYLHTNYRWFILSYTVTQLGEWLTYVASMSILKRVPEAEGSILISYLVVSRMVPSTLFSFMGGILADTKDRRHMMLTLDAIGAMVAVGYLWSQSSILILYICAILQSTLSGLYQPSRSSILPMLVEPEYLEKANEISSIIWSLSAAVGASLGGFLVDHFGPSVCFATDSTLYVLSACILAVMVKGDYCVRTKIEKSSNGWSLQEVGAFLTTNDAAPFLLVKVFGALLFGASDVINATFSQVNGVLSSQRLGWMFASVGAGCLLGPLLVQEGRSYVASCVVSYLVLGIGYGLIGITVQFWPKCVWTIFRSAGAAVLWVDSSIILQKATPSTVLGRISSMDFALATLGESASAVFAGLLQDHGASANQVALILSGMGFAFAIAWTIGLVCCCRRRSSKEDLQSVELEPLQEAVVT